MSSNLWKVYIGLRWACHLSKVIHIIDMSTNLQLCKSKRLQLDFNSNECNSKFGFTTNTFPWPFHSSNLETKSSKMDEHYHSSWTFDLTTKQYQPT